MKITKNMIGKIREIVLMFDDGEYYIIDSADILDFRTSEIEGSKIEWTVDDGRLVISKDVFENIDMDTALEVARSITSPYDESVEDACFYYRVMKCCDIRTISVDFKDGDRVEFEVPFHPYESSFPCGARDMSNCPSAELNENGDLVILFGKSSHAYKRKDNNYSELIIGLDEIVKTPIKGILSVRMSRFQHTDAPGGCRRYFLDSKIKNNGYDDLRLNLVFEDVREPSIDVDFGATTRQVRMSRLSNGEIYVEIEKFGGFYCKAVKTFAFYNTDEGGYDVASDERYRKALACEVSEEEMRSLMLMTYVGSMRKFDCAAFDSAKNKVLNGEISVGYFRYWVGMVAALLFPEGALIDIRVKLDRLKVGLSYYNDISECRKMIEDAADEIEIIYLENFDGAQ